MKLENKYIIFDNSDKYERVYVYDIENWEKEEWYGQKPGKHACCYIGDIEYYFETLKIKGVSVIYSPFHFNEYGHWTKLTSKFKSALKPNPYKRFNWKKFKYEIVRQWYCKKNALVRDVKGTKEDFEIKNFNKEIRIFKA